jgi:hypothetical protein
MSNDDYVVDPLRDDEVRENAKRLRDFLGVADVKRVDVLMLEKVTDIWTVKGVKPFRLDVVPDAALLHDSGLTTYDGSRVVVQIPRRIRHGAFMGDGYSRYTFGHELGHVTQHLDKLMLGASMPRRRVGNVTPDWIPKFRSAEHQAMVFGAAFLINDQIARGLSSADDISIQFGVSLPAARIYFEQMQEEIARPASSLRVLKIAEEVKAAIAPKESFSNKINFLNDPCLACGQQKVFPVGHKFMCQACDTASRTGIRSNDINP